MTARYLEQAGRVEEYDALALLAKAEGAPSDIAADLYRYGQLFHVPAQAGRVIEVDAPTMANLQLAQRALRQNDPTGALTKMLNESGYGNHPAVLDFLHAIGRSMQEGGFLKSSTNRPPGAKSAAQLLFGDNHPSNEE